MSERFANAWALLPCYLSQHVMLSAAAMALGLVVSLALVVETLAGARFGVNGHGGAPPRAAGR